MATTEAQPHETDMLDVTEDSLSASKKPRDEDGTEITRPRKKPKNRSHHLLHQATLRKPSWTYFHLSLFSPSSNEPLDILTAKRYLTSALQRFLGLYGAAISVDILKLDRKELWIRVPREDAPAVHEAVSAWLGDGVKWVVKGRDEWLVRLGSGDGQDLFEL
jgi:ribonuclease P/MRP protein subunit POP8